MPHVSPEEHHEYTRAWYHRPENRERTIRRVAQRKWEEYFGICVNCGRKTQGQSKANPGPAWCGRPECRSAARRPSAVPAFLLQEVLRLAKRNDELELQNGLLHNQLHALEKVSPSR